MGKRIRQYILRHRLDIGIIMTAIVVAVGINALGIPENMQASGTKILLAHQISAKQACAGELNADGNISMVYEKNCDEKAYPASTTKIMTALIVLETMEKLSSPIEQKITVPDSALGAEGSSIYLKKDEKISIEDLLYGMMLRSGNDAALALAHIIGGNVENFVDMMNIRAAELGCVNTNFVNPNGLFDENHYTTAREMAIITAEAMKNDDFRKIVSAQQYNACREENNYTYFYNKNKTVHQYKGGNGVKIGYTKKSGRTLVASAEREGKTVICVVMNAPDWFNDAYALMDAYFVSQGE
ncbi:MAG: D-alanyl-D-alanine carboxypeptidase [Eubacteriales bacterium]|nr:D-alanyl-D-alanine carboxypeptidase [Eubacteriales bacterium]MDD4390500.1 D-alanyl-D-alanine carboxypeptidase [Eubacteriales bacterium]